MNKHFRTFVDIKERHVNFVKQAKRLWFLVISFVMSLTSYVFFSFHFTHIYYANNISWATWLFSLFFLFLAFLHGKKDYLRNFKIDKKYLLLVFLVIVVYWVSHLFNFSTAPWNSNGLFDDAAWDIYFAKNHVLVPPAQAAYFDTVGYISREVVFHYYITLFFKVFGYNLLIFNFSLMLLGFTTVLFTTLIVYRLFKNLFLAVTSLFLINFLPLHFMHVFMGHRYAIEVPLMMISLYFLHSAFLDRSYIKAVVSALFAALCLDSAIMGKQYLLGLFAAGFLSLFYVRKRKLSKNLGLTSTWMVGFIISAAPILTYILFNYNDYSLREHGLLRDFLESFSKGGLFGIAPYTNQLKLLFFAKKTFERQFLVDFYPIPLTYYFLLVPGLVILFYKKRFEILLLATIPIFATFVSGSYDFRILPAAPFWIISIIYFIDWLRQKFIVDRKSWINWFFLSFSFLLVLIGLLQSISYIIKVSEDPNYQYLLPHKDVAVSRVVQDLVIAANNPTDKMKISELNRRIDISKVSFDTFFCPYSSYAIAHLFLQNYDDKKILSFCNEGIQLLKTPQEILSDNLRTIENYNGDKDLKLIWEVSPKSIKIIENFKQFEKYGFGQTVSGRVDGNNYSLYLLTIDGINMVNFKKEVLDMRV